MDEPRHRRHRRAARRPPPSEPVDGHGHAHGHGPAPAVSPRIRWLLAAVLVPCALATVLGIALTYPFGYEAPEGADLGFGQRPVHGEVVETRAAPCSAGAVPDAPAECVALTITLRDGPAPDTSIQQTLPIEPSTPRFAVGDQVVLAYNGGPATEDVSYYVVDFQRGMPMLWLAGLFVAAVLLLGRWQGVRSLATLGLTFMILIWYIFPTLVAGVNPVTVAVLGAAAIMFLSLYLTHGLSARTSTAIMGTLLSLALIWGLGTVFTAATRVTGLDDQTVNLINVLGVTVDPRGLLLASIVIGALGVLDDVTVTQASAVWELHAANPRLGWTALYRRALRIGRDHISSAVNTLALAYAGAALPLLIAYSVSGQSFATLVTAQDVAQEVVRTLVGSIGLVASVPLTTLFASWMTMAGSTPARSTPAGSPPARSTR